MLFDSNKEIKNFFESAQESVVIVAPYIKTSALVRILEVLPRLLNTLVVVTRWYPRDIASGVCDLEIFDHILDHGGTLKILPHLHAKYYRVDGSCIVGSANLTKSGFGWSLPANIELSIELPANHEGLVEWEKHLLHSSIEVNDDILDAIKSEVAEIEASDSDIGNSENSSYVEGSDLEFELQNWTPSCTVPERLWVVYCGTGDDIMVDTAYKAARRDLTVLAPPKGLTLPLFNNFVKGILRQMPLIYRLDRLSKIGLPDIEAINFLSDAFSEYRSVSPEVAWNTLKAWFMHFFPDEYRIESQQDVLVRGRSLDI